LKRIQLLFKKPGISILAINKSSLAKDVWFSDMMMFLLLQDGREIGFPLEWFPKLRASKKEGLQNWRLIGGEGIHWEALDEDILVEALL
jgi:hypothetical protein